MRALEEVRKPMLFSKRPRTDEFEAAAMPHMNDIYRTAARLLGNAAGADDVVQDVYMQASGEGEGPYALEHRDGGADQHFSAGSTFGKADVLRAFLWYLAGDSRWRTEFSWQKLENKPWWKFW